MENDFFFQLLADDIDSNQLDMAKNDGHGLGKQLSKKKKPSWGPSRRLHGPKRRGRIAAGRKPMKTDICF